MDEFATLEQAREVLEMWKHDNNHQRPHDSLGRLTPNEFDIKGPRFDSGELKFWL